MASGFFDDLIEGLGAHLDIKAAIEMSRGPDGKPDAGKATGIVMGLGHTSADDMADLAAMLGAEGAFDD